MRPQRARQQRQRIESDRSGPAVEELEKELVELRTEMASRKQTEEAAAAKPSQRRLQYRRTKQRR